MRFYSSPREKTTQELLHDTLEYKELREAVRKKEKIESVIESAEEIREYCPRRFSMSKFIEELKKELTLAKLDVNEKNEAYEKMKGDFITG